MPDRAFIETLHAEREKLVRQLAAVDQAIEAFEGEAPRHGGTFTPRPPVGEESINKVRQYLVDHGGGPVRQADIASDTAMNSGLVSYALKALEQDHEAERGPKQGRSFTWTLAST
jgi:hypothetical protein